MQPRAKCVGNDASPRARQRAATGKQRRPNYFLLGGRHPGRVSEGVLGWFQLRNPRGRLDRKSTRLNSSHVRISYAVFCLKKKKSNSGHPWILKKKKNT